MKKVRYRTRHLALEAFIDEGGAGVFILTPGNNHAYVSKSVFLELFEPIPEGEESCDQNSGEQ